MAQSLVDHNLNLGFLTIAQDGRGYVGGYLVTNLWGRPLEFRLSSAVEPNRTQQVLYGASLEPYICADLIGKALVEKAGTPVKLLVTDHELTLDLRHRLTLPLVWLASAGEVPRSAEAVLRPAQNGKPALVRHHRYPDDAAAIRTIVDALDPAFDLLEPFERIRAAMGEGQRISPARAA